MHRRAGFHIAGTRSRPASGRRPNNAGNRLRVASGRPIARRRYLTSRHFYTRLDLDGAASELADPRTKAMRFENSIHGTLGNGGLQRVFEALSENQRQTLRLYFFEGYTFDE